MSRVSNTTRRHPRTLQEAFGPYCSERITDAESRETRWHRAMYILAVIFAALLVAGYFGSIA